MEENYSTNSNEEVSLKGKKILIVSFYFAPFNCVGALRVTKTAKYLEKQGNTVHVLTAKELPLPDNLAIEGKSIVMHSTSWLNVNRPAEFFSGGRGKVAIRGYASGVGKFNVKGWLGRLYKGFLNIPDGQIGWYPFACKAGKSLLKQQKYDLIYASAWPVTSLVVASKLSKISKVPWVCELRDLWTQSPYINLPVWRRPLDGWLEKKVLSTATGFVTVSEPLAEQLRGRVNVPVEVVTNGFDLSDNPKFHKISNSYQKIKIVHTGTIYPGKRDPSVLFQALKAAASLGVTFEVEFYGRYSRTIWPLVEKYGLNETVKIYDSISQKDALEKQADADILLLLLWNNQSERGTFTGKFFEYMGSRKPILVIGPKSNVASRLVCKEKLGWVCSTAEEVKIVLEKLSQNELRALVRHIRKNQSIKSFSREEQIRKLDSFLNHLLDFN